MSDAGIKKIYVFADGPRTNEEQILTDKVRAEVARFNQDHKDLTIITNYSTVNIGLRENIITGLNSVFSKESAAIIIEDDCQPSPDFFRFTNAMLSKYQDNEGVMSINGMSVGGDYEDVSYGFTKYPQCWGWATWSRSWQMYDPDIKSFNHNSWHMLAGTQKLSTILKYYFEIMFNMVQKKQINTWDFQWTYAHFTAHALAVSPSVNLVTNIGFDSAATNTKMRSSVAGLVTHDLPSVFIHPTQVFENISVSRAIERSFYTNPIAILGLLRQYIYYLWRAYAHRA